MAKTLKDLLLALLNATLILVALCLFLGWKLASTVDDITTGFAEKVQIVAPLKDEIRGIRGELVALRTDLAAIQQENTGANISEKLQMSTALVKLDNLEAQLQATQSRIAELTEAPELLLDAAIEKAAGEAADHIVAIRGCVPAS